MDNAETFLRRLVAEHPSLTPILNEHLEEYDGQILSHLLLADVVRELVRRSSTELDFCQSVLGWLERQCQGASDEIRGLIAVSGVELIPDSGDPGAELRELLGPCLSALNAWELRTTD